MAFAFRATMAARHLRVSYAPSAVTVLTCSSSGICSRRSGNEEGQEIIRGSFPRQMGLSPSRPEVNSTARMSDVMVSMAKCALRHWRLRLVPCLRTCHSFTELSRPHRGHGPSSLTEEPDAGVVHQQVQRACQAAIGDLDIQVSGGLRGCTAATVLLRSGADTACCSPARPSRDRSFPTGWQPSRRFDEAAGQTTPMRSSRTGSLHQRTSPVVRVCRSVPPPFHVTVEPNHWRTCFRSELLQSDRFVVR